MMIQMKFFTPVAVNAQGTQLHMDTMSPPLGWVS